MTKDNILFGVIGVLLGLIVGFMFANAVNKSAVTNSGVVATQPGGDPNQAHLANMPEVQQAIERAKNEPENFDAQLMAAEFHYRIQRFDSAIELLLIANKLKPEDRPVMVHLGNAYFDSNKFEDAEKWYTSALVKKAEDPNVRTDLGLTFMFRANPDYDRAIKEFMQSLSVDPNHKPTLQNLTVAYTKKGDGENAKSTLAKLESIDSANPNLQRLRDDIGKIGS